MCLPGHHGAAAVRGEGTGAPVQGPGFGCSSPMKQGRVLMTMGELLGHTPGRMGAAFSCGRWRDKTALTQM